MDRAGNEWEDISPHFMPPPPPVVPPSDAALRQRIERFVDYAARNSSDFVRLTREKQRGNPDFSFLDGGEGSAYYSWLLHAAGTVPSVQASRDWFLACRQHAASMGAMLQLHGRAHAGGTPSLAALYLGNDVLTAGGAGAEAGADVARALLPHLGSILAAAACLGGLGAQHAAGFLTLWEGQGIFGAGQVADLRAQMERGLGGDLEEVRARAREELGRWAADARGGSEAGNAVPRNRAAPLPPLQLQEPAVEPAAFPPGLIPELVRAQLETHAAYTPLDPQAVKGAGVPPPPIMDAYLSSRAEKFYAQLADYRPGAAYSDIEPDLVRRKTAQACRDWDRERRSQPAAAVDDGSGPRHRSGSGARGLGYRDEPPAGDKADVFASYRSQLSGAYYDMIHRSLVRRGR